MRLPPEERLRPLQKVALRVVKAMTGRASGPVLVASNNNAVLEDWRTAPISDRLRATLTYLEALTLRPTEVKADTMRTLQAAGVSAQAIREATYVCFLFNVLDRLADALDFALPTEEEAQKIGSITFRLGYGIAKLPG